MKLFNLEDPLPNRLFLAASAGTGKTYTLEHLFLKKLEEGIPLEKMLMVTFTKASVKELKVRFRQALQNRLQQANNVLSSKERQHLSSALKRFDQASIHTIHGFAYRTLASHVFETGFSFSYDEGSLVIEEKMEAAKLLLHSDLEGFGLSQLQRLVSLKPSVHELEQWLIEEEGQETFASFEVLHKEAVAAVTQAPLFDLVDLLPLFKKGAKKSLVEVWQKKFDVFRKTLSLEAFDELLLLGTKVAKTFAPEQARKRLKEEEKELLSQPSLTFLQTTFFPLLLYALDTSILKKRLASALAPLMEERLTRTKKKGPDELLLSLLEATKNQAFCQAVQEEFSLVMIDEFQDTDTTQWSIFSNLFLSDWDGTFIVVGDPKQSIYRFRKADLYTYLAARKQLNSEASLVNNYRSHPNLVHTLNEFFSFSPFLTLPKWKTSLDYTQVTPAREGDAEERRVCLFTHEDASLIDQDLIASLQEKEAKGCAVLVRDRIQASHVKNLLDKASLPSFLLKPQSYKGAQVLLWIKAWLLAIENPFSLPLIKRALLTPLCGYSLASLEKAPFPDILYTFSKLHEGFCSHGLFFAYHLFEKATWRETTSSWKEEIEKVLQEGASTFTEAKESLDRLYLGLERAPRPLFSPQDAEGEGVAILTVHMSKGLEFDHVFCYAMQSPLKPPEVLRNHPPGLSANEAYLDKAAHTLEIEECENEWLRHIYVCLTRAKESLWIPNHLTKKRTYLSFLLEKRGCLPETLEKRSSPKEMRSISFAKKEQKLFLPPTIRTYQPKHFWITSHTQLAKKGQTLHPKIETKEKTPYTLPPGKRTGLVLHALLEKIPFGQYKTEEEYQAFTKLHLATGFLSDWSEVIGSMLYHLFTLKLPCNFSLQEVSSHNVAREKEFLYPTDSFGESIQMVQGTVDALIYHKGLYYLLDWKTNWLGPHQTAYEQNQLHTFLQESDYPLQAALYTEAFKRYVHLFEKKPFEELFGGFLFIFCRGVCDQQGAILWNP